MIQERESIIDLINMAERKNVGQNNDVEKVLVSVIKDGTQTSPGLAAFLTSASSRYPWGTAKFIFMMLISISSLALAISSYSFDVSSDMSFIEDNDRLASRSEFDYSNCSESYKEILDENVNFINTNEDAWFTSKTKRQEAIKLAERMVDATECFKNEERFLDDRVKDSSQWEISAMATWVHVIMPLAFMLPLWLVILVRRRQAASEGCCTTSCREWITGIFKAFFMIPWVPINRLVNCFWEIRVHYNEMSKREATEEEKNHWDRDRRRDDEFYVQKYKKEKERLTKKIENNTSLGKFK